MHPFYSPSARLVGGRESSTAGLVSMAAYLAFWAVAIGLARRELDARFPRGGRAAATPATDPAVALLRERFARGEIDVEEFRARLDVLLGPLGSTG
jgi:putative membrane protein